MPRILILGTGGTIASLGATSVQTTGYLVTLTLELLLSQIGVSTDGSVLPRGILVTYLQLFNIDSKEIGHAELWRLYRLVAEAVANPLVDGVVVTHGTDTMEESAFFLQCVVRSDKPVVLCGSMRPLTAISADGPMNLYQAIEIAASPRLCGRGVLVTLNDLIGLGLYSTKLNANSLDTFKLVGQGGYLGTFVNNEVHYYYPPLRPYGTPRLKLDRPGPWPAVWVIYAHQDLDPQMVACVAGHGVKGIVVATMGAGSLSTPVIAALEEVRAQGVVVVYSKRLMDGVVPGGVTPAVASGWLNPAKSRILLQLVLAEGGDENRVREVFREVSGG